MKNLILIALFLMVVSANAQMDNLSNLSVEWMRTGARNAATDAADIAVYNPAGLTNLENGLHINFSNQTLMRSPSHTYDLGLGEGVKTHTQDGIDPFLPELFLSYNFSKWSFFGASYFSGGGATMNYPTGSITTDLIGMGAVMSTGGVYMNATNQNLKASSMYLTFMAGATHDLSSKVSVSLAIRHIDASNKVKGGMTLTASPIDFPDQPLALEYEENANGVGAVAGINIKCSDVFNLSARYESQVKLDFKTKQITDDFGVTTDGQMNRRDLPAVAAMGAQYKVIKKLKVLADFNYFFQENADWGKSTVLTNEQPLSSLAGNAFGTGLGFEYAVSPKFTASLGGGYTKYLYNDKPGYYTHLGTFEVVQDDNSNINLGFAYQPSQKLKLNVAYMHTFWKESEVNAMLAQPLDMNVTVNNAMNAFGVGVEFAF